MSKPKTKSKYTLVQHSAWVVERNPQFEHAVEHVYVSDAEAKKVLKVGGLIFTDYIEGDEAAMAANYPEEVTGMIPCVRGTFSKTKVDNSPVYIPPGSEGFHHTDMSKEEE